MPDTELATLDTDIQPRPRQRAAAPTPSYKRITRQQTLAMLDLRKLGKTQVEIAQTIGCDQRTVSRWLAEFTDTTEHATAYLRGKALDMAQNIVKKGRAADHVAVLKGVSVLKDDERSGLTIQIGIKDSEVTFACGAQGLERNPAESGVIVQGSDKSGYVNEAK